MKAKDLKNSILQMAVEGKLVSQDPADEPASALLEKIRKVRHKLIAEGKAKFPKGGESIIYIGSDGSPYEKCMDAKGRVTSNRCIADEVPFEIPESWTWVRLSAVASFGGGKTPSTNDKSNYAHDGVLWVTSKDMKRDHIDSTLITLSEKGASELTLYEKGCIVMVTRSGILRRLLPVAVLDKPATVNQDQKVIIPDDHSLSEWLLCYFQGSDYRIRTEFGKDGTTVESVVFDKVKEMLIPLPPLAEQRRIVGRVGELMPLVEEYGGLEDAREALDAALPGRLRKSVLQLAVRGGLVPQNPTDEPAGVLLERIRGQRRQLVAGGKMRAPKGGESIIFAGSDGRRYEKRVDVRGRESEPVCIEDEIPFEIPRGWEWARLESVTSYIQRGKSPKYSATEKYPVVAQKCNQWSGFSMEKARFIDPATVSKYADERILKDGDLLWNSTGLGTLGRMAIYDSAKNKYGWAVADSHVTVIRTREDWLDYRYAFAYFAGPSVQSVIEEQASGSTKQKELAQETVRNYLIPVAPLAEQRRIVNEAALLFKILA